MVKSKTMKVLKCRDIVKDILTNRPETRDNDIELMFKVWHSQCDKLQYIFFMEVYFMLLEGKLSPPESIRRSRQWLQSKYPELRGNRWVERHTTQKTETEEELEYIRTPDDAPGMKP